MLNRLLKEKELNVKVGDRVSSHGYKGTVTKVYHGYRTEWNGTEYTKIKDSDYTLVTIHFDDTENIARYGQYQDGEYGLFTVI